MTSPTQIGHRSSGGHLLQSLDAVCLIQASPARESPHCPGLPIHRGGEGLAPSLPPLLLPRLPLLLLRSASQPHHRGRRFHQLPCKSHRVGIATGGPTLSQFIQCDKCCWDLLPVQLVVSAHMGRRQMLFKLYVGLYFQRNIHYIVYALN